MSVSFMATQKKRKEMVFHKKGANVTAKAPRPEQPPPSFVLLKPLRTGGGDGTVFTEKVEDPTKKPSAGGSSPTKAILENLPAKISCHGLSVTLDNNVMWNEFFRCQTEMILTQDGSRMFPYCRFRISGLDASKKYSLVVDIQPVDSSQYEWTGHNWQVAGKAMRHLKNRPFSHPDSPATGQHWMEQPVSFYKLKLTNMVSGQGNLVLHPLHRYIPCLHIVPFSANAKKELKLSGPRVATFTFPQTEFFAVTAYQNSRFTQLKVNYNPFAKGFKDERSSSLALKPQTSDNKEADPSNNQNPIVKKTLKSLLANHRPRSSTAADHNHSEILIPTTTSSTEELYSKAKPSQKLFSELIREAHVSLRRCNLDKMVASMKSSYTGNKLKEAVTEIELPLPADCTAVDEKSTTASCPSKSPIKPIVSSLDCKSKSEPQPEENVRTHKRPALVPLPALARFLSKHQSKQRNLGTRQEPLNIPPSEVPPPPKAGPPPKAAPGVQSTVGSHSGSHCISPLSTLHHQEPTQESHMLTSQIVSPQPKELESTLLSLSADLPLSTSQQIHFPTSAPEGLPTAIDTLLADISNSSTISSSGSTNKPTPFLLDSSAIGFESLSPVSSPEPLTPLPVSLGLETVPAPSVVNTTLKWHSLFPQPDPFLTSFTPFFSTPQSPTHNPPTQPCQEAPSVSSDPLLHEDEYQSLPFPGELSPLTLQLSLSPTFSSLDGGALSPTPSLSDLLSFISTDNHNLLLEAEVGKAEPVPVPCPALLLTHPTPRPPPCPQVQSEPEPTTKPAKVKKKCRKGQSKGAITACDAVYTKMQPSLEEVEEQLFVSFTSKEALKLHVQDLPEGPVTQSLEASREDPPPSTPSPEGELPQPSTPPPDTGGIGDPATGGPVSPHEGPEDIKESIAASKMMLLRDLKLMKNRQVIHPVLQEVGLKMHLLDPAMAIDLQYLGVRLPIPPHPVSVDAQALPPQEASPQTPPPLPPQSVSLDFVSRTGKTSDLTQIKGWREKFSPSESSTSSSSSRPEAAASAEPPSKNLSAFCSDMLDEYLETEGKFLDQHASSFAQAPPEPLAYNLPTQSSSYVRTLSSVLKKQPLSAPTSALISSFVPPSKRARSLPTTTTTTTTKKSKADKKQKTGGSKLKSKPGPATGDSAPANSSTASVSPKAAGPEPPLTLTPATIPARLGLPSAQPPLTSQTQDGSKANPAPTAPPSMSTVNPTTSKKTKKLKLAAKDSLSDGQEPAPGHQDLAPLESDSELDPAAGDEARSRPPQPKALVSVTLLKQRDLEERVAWEGRARTFITEERASIALTSLFTTAGFVREDPTAPIQLAERRAPACLNDFCRLGCVCSSLAHARPITHCGKAQCMLGCSCLRQKVVLLKNLDGLDSLASGLDPSKRKRRKRMKMAYVLKETESVAQPAQPVRTLWKGGDLDPEPMHTTLSTGPRTQARRTSNYGMTCSRVRLYTGRKTERQPRTAECLKEAEEQPAQTRDKAALPAGLPQPVPPYPGRDMPKHLVIVADCHWPSPEVQTQVLKAVCQSMARERLHIPLWFNGYYAKLLSFAMKDGAIHYKVRISEGKPDGSTPPLASTSPAETGPTETKPTRRGRRKVEVEEVPEDWQKEVEEEEAPEDWQKEVEEEEAPEDWQKEVQEEDEDPKDAKMRMRRMGLPFLAGLSHAGFLSAHLKESGGDDLLVQVNRKSYPTAMVQLGRMGALHPANRLAAYLTGRAVPSRPQAPPASGSAAVTMATVPPAATTVPSGQKSAWTGSPGVQPGHYYLYNTIGQASQTVTRRLVKLVPLSQVSRIRDLNEDRRTTAGNPAGLVSVVQEGSLIPPSAKPAPSAGTCQLQLVSANHSRRIIVNVPKIPLPTKTVLSGTHKNISPAPSSGTHENVSPAPSSGTHENVRPAPSSGTHENVRPAPSSGTHKNVRPAGSSGTLENVRLVASSLTDLNIICVDNDPDVLTNEEHVGVAGMSNEEKPSLVAQQRAENKVSDSKLENRLRPEPMQRRGNHRPLKRQCRRSTAGGSSGLQMGEETPKVTILKQVQEEVLEPRSWESSPAQLRGSLSRQREEHTKTLAHSAGNTEDSISRELPQPSNQSTRQGQTGSRTPSAETDEQTENSSFEEDPPPLAVDRGVSLPSDQEVDIDSAEEEEEHQFPGKHTRRLVSAFKALRSELNVKTRTRLQLLAQAYRVIGDLDAEETRCKEEVEALKRQRSKLVNTISAKSGRPNKKILEKLQSITAKQRQLEETRPKAPPTRGATPLDLTTTTSRRKPPPQPQACRDPQLPSPASPPPPPPLRVRTVPNILSRSKLFPRQSHVPAPAPSNSAEAPPAAAMPPGLLSFLCPLPGQVITLKPMSSDPGARPANPGVASVSLDLSYPANESKPQRCLPRPSTSTPFPTLMYLLPSAAPLPPPQPPQDQAAEPPGPLLLHRTLPPGPPPQQTLSAGPPPQQTLPPEPPPQQTLSAGPPPQQTLPPEPPPQQNLSAGPPPQQTLSAGPPPHQTLSAGPPPQQTLSAGPPPQQTGLQFSRVPGCKLEACALSAQSPAVPETAPPRGPQPGTLSPEEVPPGPGPSSLLNQISVLNQSHGPLAGRPTSVPGPPPSSSSLGRHMGGVRPGACGPPDNSPLEPSLSNEDLTEAMQVNGRMQSADGPGPNVGDQLHYPQCISKGGTLALPPLLQMKVGGAKVSQPPNDGADGAWKPMPRLAAMGVKNPTLTSKLT